MHRPRSSVHGKPRSVATTRHELRQPLQALMLLNAALSRQALDVQARQIVEAQRQSLESMARLVRALPQGL